MTQKRRVIYMTDPEWSVLQMSAETHKRSISAIIRQAVDALLYPVVPVTFENLVAEPDPYPHIPDPRRPRQDPEAQAARDAILNRVNRKKTGE